MREYMKRGQDCRRAGRGCVLALLLCAVIWATVALLAGQAEPLLRFLQYTDIVWEQPAAFGLFHLCCLSGCILLAVIAARYGAARGREGTDSVVFAAGILLLLLEVWKQWVSYLSQCGGKYDFGIFPFQFCSLPLYLFLLTPLLREGVLKEAFYRFSALFGTVGGGIVMGYPAFTVKVGLCIHTMLWHTVMIAVGLFLLFSRGYGKRFFRDLIPAGIVFLFSVSAATGLNFLLTPFASESPRPLNLFYMSPYEITYFWVIGDVQRTVGWGAALAVYILLFLSAAALVWGITRFIRFCAEKRAQKYSFFPSNSEKK